MGLSWLKSLVRIENEIVGALRQKNEPPQLPRCTKGGLETRVALNNPGGPHSVVQNTYSNALDLHLIL